MSRQTKLILTLGQVRLLCIARYMVVIKIIRFICERVSVEIEEWSRVVKVFQVVMVSQARE